LFGEPLWAGAADRVQLRSDTRVSGIRVHFVGSAPRPAAHSAAVFPDAGPVLDAGPGQPPIIARRAWGAGHAQSRHPSGYGTVELAFVHHTVSPNGYSAAEVPSMLLAIFDYHVQVRGFLDIAYNFLIDAFGRVWEGRAGGIDSAVIGAHAGGYNAQSTGVAVLGNFAKRVPSHAAIGVLERLLAWKLSLHGLPAHGRVTVVVDPTAAYDTPFRPGTHVSLPRVAGHRDGDSTDCPGNAFYHRLPAIRPRIAALAGAPALLTISPSTKSTTAEVSLTASGALALLDGSPLAAAPIEVQQLEARGERTIATATTAADGTWSASFALKEDTAVRALHRPYPAAVADWIEILVAPAITLSVQSTTPLQVTGTIVPSKPELTVDVYAGDPASKPVSSAHVAVSKGAFAATIPIPGPGSYVLVARSPADAASTAGASAPVAVTVS
jgi:hypothetical protein